MTGVLLSLAFHIFFFDQRFDGAWCELNIKRLCTEHGVALVRKQSGRGTGIRGRGEARENRSAMRG